MKPAKLKQIVTITALLAAFSSVLFVAGGLAYKEDEDLTRLRQQGEAFLDGNFFWQGKYNWSASYPPFFSVLFAILGLASAEATHYGWLMVNLACTGLIIFLIRRRCREDGIPPPWPLWLACFFIAGASWRVTLRQGQLSLLVLMLVMAGLDLLGRKREMPAGLVLGLSLVKASLTGLFLLPLLMLRKWRALAAAAAVPLVLLLVFSARFSKSPLEILTLYIGGFLKSTAKGPGLLHGNYELVSLIRGIPGIDGAGLMITTLAAVLVAGWAWLNRNLPPAGREYGLSIAAGVAFCNLWGFYHRVYDGVVLILPAILFARWTGEPQRRRAGWTGLAGLALLALNPAAWLPRLLPPGTALAAEMARHSDRFILAALCVWFFFHAWPTRRRPADASPAVPAKAALPADEAPAGTQ